MANWTIARPGQIEAAGDENALFLKVFSGEVLATFDKKNVMLPITQVQTIPSGKSAQFPVTGIVTSGYHTPGVEIVGQAVKQDRKSVV